MFTFDDAADAIGCPCVIDNLEYYALAGAFEYKISESKQKGGDVEAPPNTNKVIVS
ncbi:MAG: hypothetical protein ACKVS6_14960 [Planctomycetota bacterium]